MPRRNYPRRIRAQVRRSQRIAKQERDELYRELEQELHTQWNGQHVERPELDVDTPPVNGEVLVKPLEVL